MLKIILFHTQTSYILQKQPGATIPYTFATFAVFQISLQISLQHTIHNNTLCRNLKTCMAICVAQDIIKQGRGCIDFGEPLDVQRWSNCSIVFASAVHSHGPKPQLRATTPFSCSNVSLHSHWFLYIFWYIFPDFLPLLYSALMVSNCFLTTFFNSQVKKENTLATQYQNKLCGGP